MPGKWYSVSSKMASVVVRANGNSGSTAMGPDVKIMVCGDRNCGKTKFIRAFTTRYGNVDPTATAVKAGGHARIYSLKYEIDSNKRNLKIFEIFGANSGNFIDQLTNDHYDANGFIFMYVIDNRESFDRLAHQWIPILEGNECKDNQPCILIGNKKDVIGSPDADGTPAEINPLHVTPQEGEDLKTDKTIYKFYETSSLDENDGNIQTAFHDIVGWSVEHWKKNTGQE